MKLVPNNMCLFNTNALGGNKVHNFDPLTCGAIGIICTLMSVSVASLKSLGFNILKL